MGYLDCIYIFIYLGLFWIEDLLIFTATLWQFDGEN
jgi:hypothetical protein